MTTVGLSCPQRPRAPRRRPLDPAPSRALSLVTICLLWALFHYAHVSLVVLRLVRCEELVLLSSRSGARSRSRLCRHPIAIRPPCQESSCFLPSRMWLYSSTPMSALPLLCDLGNLTCAKLSLSLLLSCRHPTLALRLVLLQIHSPRQPWTCLSGLPLLRPYFACVFFVSGTRHHVLSFGSTHTLVAPLCSLRLARVSTAPAPRLCLTYGLSAHLHTCACPARIRHLPRDVPSSPRTPCAF